MPRKGRDLEKLVAILEKHLDGTGATVVSPDYLPRGPGLNPQEVDVVVRNTVGYQNVEVVFQVRDRQATDEVAWIRELHGLRDEFRLQSVVAVSSSGFTAGAVKAAKDFGIRLRTFDDLTANEMDTLTWLRMRNVQILTPRFNVVSVALCSDANERTTPEPQRSAVRAVLAPTVDLERPYFRQTRTGLPVSLAMILRSVGDDALTAGLTAGGPSQRRTIELKADAPESSLHIETPIGSVPVALIQVVADVRLDEQRIPISAAREYRAEGQSLATTIGWELPSHLGPVLLEIHRGNRDSSMSLTVRRREDPAEAPAERD